MPTERLRRITDHHDDAIAAVTRLDIHGERHT